MTLVTTKVTKTTSSRLLQPTICEYREKGRKKKLTEMQIQEKFSFRQI